MQKRRWHLSVSAKTRKRLLIGGGGLVALFALANIGVGVAYYDRTYPGTTLMGKEVGNVAFGDLPGVTERLALLPESILLTHDDKKVSVTPAQLGLRVDPSLAKQSAQKQRSWLPLFDVLRPARLEPLVVDRQTIATLQDELGRQFRRDATDARLTLNDAVVAIASPQNGYELDLVALTPSLLDQLGDGRTTVSVPTKTLAPKVVADDLVDDKRDLEDRLATSLTFKYQDKSRQAKPHEIAGWYQPKGATYEIADDKVQSFVVGLGSEFGIRVKDVVVAANTAKQALEGKKAATVILSKQPPAKVFSYCTAVVGIGDSNLSALRAQLRKTFTDARGWSMGGLIEFREVASECDFTVWLAAASSVPTFGGICDEVWSCRIGSNVVINFDRWEQTTPAWQQYGGGTTEEYRHMAINHETGHWFDFGHSECTGSGQKAPVMQQQSMNLGGCVFNAWPISSELQALRNGLGI